MNKLTAEVARMDIGHLREIQSMPHVGLSLKEEKYLQALEIALQVLEAEPVADMVAWNHPSEERKCSVQLRRFDLKPGPLFMLAPQPTTDTFRQIENDGWIEWSGGECPVESGRVNLKLRDGSVTRGILAECGDWMHGNRDFDIIAYRVIENDGREG